MLQNSRADVVRNNGVTCDQFSSYPEMLCMKWAAETRETSTSEMPFRNGTFKLVQVQNEGTGHSDNN